MGGVLHVVPYAEDDNGRESEADLELHEGDYEAALAMMDRVLHPALVDFLR